MKERFFIALSNGLDPASALVGAVKVPVEVDIVFIMLKFGRLRFYRN